MSVKPSQKEAIEIILRNVAKPELEDLAIQIADVSAASVIESNTLQLDDGWCQLIETDWEEFLRELHYLDLRDRLERHPTRPELVRVRAVQP